MSTSSTNEAAAEANFEIPSWSGKPPNGLHLDVVKGPKLIQKLMIDEKRCYFFGRNPKLCDFAVDHASCSRVHAVLLWHKHLKRMFLIDLGSTHGTFIGSVRLEERKPEQVQIDQTFHFGVSTRMYTLRERLTNVPMEENDENFGMEKSTAKLLGLPEREEELENLTEYNTALNRRVAAMAMPDDDFKPFVRKRKNIHVTFNDEEDIINPEDIDPSVGRFRNLVQTAIIPTKRSRMDSSFFSDHGSSDKHSHITSAPHHTFGSSLPGFGPISAKLGLSLPNSAPDVDLYGHLPQTTSVSMTSATTAVASVSGADEPKKKKYAKEAWPGKKAGHLLV